MTKTILITGGSDGLGKAIAAKTEMFGKMGIEKDMSKGLGTEDVAKTVEFILSFDKPTLFPEIGIKHIEN